MQNEEDFSEELDLEDDDIEVQPSAEPVLLLEHIVDKGQSPLRIDKFVMSKVIGATRNKVQQAIDDELVLVNGKPVKANYKVKPNDFLKIYSIKEHDNTEVVPQDIPLNIVHEDDDVIVLNKDAGMVVHPGCGNYLGTLVNGMAYYLQKQNNDFENLPRIGLVHRIDKDTTGLILFGKNEKAILYLSNQFKAHTVKRKYVALVWGDVEQDEGTIVAHVGRNIRFRKMFDAYPDGEHGKHAVTHYKVIERFNYVTLVECVLETGRTHQIRVHFKHIGHPLFGDRTYGGDRIVKGTVFTKYKQFIDNCFDILPRQALHAQTLGFVHPTTEKEILFTSELPNDIEAVVEKWRRYSKSKDLQ